MDLDFSKLELSRTNYKRLKRLGDFWYGDGSPASVHYQGAMAPVEITGPIVIDEPRDLIEECRKDLSVESVRVPPALGETGWYKVPQNRLMMRLPILL